MLTIGIACTALAVFLTVAAIGWPRQSKPMHLRALPKAYRAPLTLLGYPTPPRVTDEAEAEFWNRLGHKHAAPKPITLRGVLVGYDAE